MTLAEKWEEARQYCDALPYYKRAMITRLPDHILLVAFNRDGCRARAMKRAFYRDEQEELTALEDCMMELNILQKESRMNEIVNTSGFGGDVTETVKDDLRRFLDAVQEEITEAVLVIRTTQGVATISTVPNEKAIELLDESKAHAGYIEKSGFSRTAGI